MNWLMPSELPAAAAHGYEGASPADLLRREPQEADVEIWMQTLAPAGAWACTPSSYAKWLNTLLAALRGEATLLPEAAVARLRSLAAGSYALGWMATAEAEQVVLIHTGALNGFMTEAALGQAGDWAGFGITNTYWIDEATGASWVLSALNAQIAAMAQSRGKLPVQTASARALPAERRRSQEGQTQQAHARTGELTLLATAFASGCGRSA